MSDAPHCPRHPARGAMKRSQDGEHWFCPARIGKSRTYCTETAPLSLDDMLADRQTKYATPAPAERGLFE